MKSLLLAAFLLLASLPGSSVEPDIEFFPVSRTSLMASMCLKFGWCPFLTDRNDASLLTLDAFYYAPDAEGLKDLFRFYAKRREFTNYMVDVWDCDDFAREFTHLSRVWHRLALGKGGAGLTVGTVYVKFDGDVSDLFPGSHALQSDYHVTNVVLASNGRWFWFEPQTGSFKPVESALYEGTITVLRIEL